METDCLYQEYIIILYRISKTETKGLLGQSSPLLGVVQLIPYQMFGKCCLPVVKFKVHCSKSSSVSFSDSYLSAVASSAGGFALEQYAWTVNSSK